MSDPQTSNQLLFVPTRGSDPGTWDVPVNSNTTSIDGLFGGVQTVTVTNSPVTLTAPSGVVTASAGPTQAQNAVLNFTGTLTANVQVTLPLPGYYIIRNATVPGAFVLSFKAAGSGNVIGFPPGQTQHVFNDGTNVFFANLGNIGQIEMWAGLIAMPSWVTACTVPPYLLNDGSTFLIATYPIIGGRFNTSFGGNGVTTSAVPDHRGRMALPYDGTGTRITAAVANINGQLLGSAADNQGVALLNTQVPNLSVTASGTATVNFGNNVPLSTEWFQGANNSVTGNTIAFTTGGVGNLSGASGTASVSGSTTTGGGGQHTNVQPSIVTGISVTRAA